MTVLIKNIYQFQGCYWHGCRKCHPGNEVRHDKTIEQKNCFKANGYNLIQLYECEWNEIKRTLLNKQELDEDARQQNINVRDALFGGRAEGFLNPIINALSVRGLIMMRLCHYILLLCFRSLCNWLGKL